MARQHFLIVTFPAQGHINPAVQLAKRLLSSFNLDITFSTAISAHNRMFSSSEEFSDGQITYIPYSDGFDNGTKSENKTDLVDYHSTSKINGYRTLSNIVKSLADRSRPVTLLINTFLLSWAGDVARDLGIPSTVYWIQPATVFAIYYHYFNGYSDVIASKVNDPSAVIELPGLLPLRVRDLPSFLNITSADDPYAMILSMVGELFEFLSSSELKMVLVNTFDELEGNALTAIDNLKLVAIGPAVPGISMDMKISQGDLFKTDDKKYMEWLDSKPDNSVVYLSFGSFLSYGKQQIEEIQRGLKESGRPYLWVVRKDNREEGIEGEESGENGIVVEWCSQVNVLSHPAVGCFVTHCGWNSTLESLSCGTPMVTVPKWTDQMTNARLVEEWGIGVRGEVEDGVLKGRELARCLEIVMGEGEKAKEIRRKALQWREKARKAVEEGGSSDQNLKAFLLDVIQYMCK